MGWLIDRDGNGNAWMIRNRYREGWTGKHKEIETERWIGR